MPKPMPELTLAAAVPPDRTRVYFEECARISFSARATDYNLSNAWWLAEASLAAYETFVPDGRDRQIDLTPLLTSGYAVTAFSESSTQFLTIENSEALIVAFRGTRLDDLVIPFLDSPGVSPNWADVGTDSRFLLQAIDPGLYVHEGFLSAYAFIEQKLAAALEEALTSGKPIWLCGHSLGAALATIAAYKYRGRIHGLYTFGSPRVGNGSFANALKEGLQNIYRFVHHRDAVPTMPPEGLPLASHADGWRNIIEAIRNRHSAGYAHVGQLKYISGLDTWHIQDDGSPLNSIGDLTKDAIAYSKDIADTLARRFSIRHPTSWPILLRGIADHSPLYYTNKIFNAHEEHATPGERSTEERS